jgi:4,5-DOPA dioxygenase extradiol
MPDLTQARSFYLSHGGGPLPLLGDPLHAEMCDLLVGISQSIVRPAAIVVISAHWEASAFTITSASQPAQIYDYYGFPAESYDIKYMPAGNPVLAREIHDLIAMAGLPAVLDDKRGFDHGLFVPLKIMYPDADIPCVQLSLMNSLDPDMHIRAGRALAKLADANILILGSGFSFHNMKAFFSERTAASEKMNQAFDDWLVETCTSREMSESDRASRLLNWSDAPFAGFNHPREEHLIPLHVCYGAAGEAATKAYSLDIINRKASMFIWS